MVKIERKQSILLSAEELFADKGFFSTSIADIIDHAKIARGTFYLYFDSKKSIFDTLLDDFIYKLHSSIKRIDISPDATDPLDQLKENVMNVAALLYNRGNLTKILLNYATGIDNELDHKIQSFYNEILELLETAISLGIEMEIIRPCKPEVIAHCIIGSIKEIAQSFIMDKYSVNEIEMIVDELIQFTLKGLLSK